MEKDICICWNINDDLDNLIIDNECPIHGEKYLNHSNHYKKGKEALERLRKRNI